MYHYDELHNNYICVVYI